MQAALTDVKNLDPSTGVGVLAHEHGHHPHDGPLPAEPPGRSEAVGIDSSELQSAFTQLTTDLKAIPGSWPGPVGRR